MRREDSGRDRVRLKHSACAMALAAMLVGCTTTYEGAGDYRFAATDINKHVEFVEKFELASENTKPSGYFKPHDPISIYLKSAFFVWCPPHWVEQISATVVGRRAKCRVAVLVNVGSRLEQVADHASKDTPGRIVYYSRDVQTPQFINQSEGLLYSASAWDGNDLTLDVTILEMATEDTKQAEEMLKALASVGTSSNLSIGGQQLIGALNTVGSAFVRASSKDAVIGQYRFSLLRPSSDSAAHIPKLREGDLVLVRARDDERETIDWKNYIYDPSVGKLFQRIAKGSEKAKFCTDPEYANLRQEDESRIRRLDKNGSQSYCYIEAHHRNYLVFSFVKSAAATDWVPTTTLATLQTAIQTSPAAIERAAGALADGVIHRGTFNQARESIKKLKSSTTAAAVKGYEAQRLAGIVQCGYINSLAAVAEGVRTYAETNCGGEAWHSRAVSAGEFDYLAQQLVACNATVSQEALLGEPADGSKAAEARRTFGESIAALSCT